MLPNLRHAGTAAAAGAGRDAGAAQSTQFLGGHGDVIAGVVACDTPWASALRQVRAAIGGLLHPLGAYLLHRGLQTWSLRVRKAQENAQSLALRLAAHPAVARVFYPDPG